MVIVITLKNITALSVIFGGIYLTLEQSVIYL